MLRQVMIPSKDNSTISIPPEYYGTKVEVLVYPFNENSDQETDSIKNIFSKYLYSFDKYKFSRDEANDYE